MNERLLFRAWYDGEMMYQGGPDLETLSSFMHHYSDKPLMQYTGRLDDNGIRIYENDTVKCIDNTSSEIIISNVEWFRFAWRIRKIFLLTEFDNILVIGNTYEGLQDDWELIHRQNKIKL